MWRQGIRQLIKLIVIIITLLTLTKFYDDCDGFNLNYCSTDNRIFLHIKKLELIFLENENFAVSVRNLRSKNFFVWFFYVQSYFVTFVFIIFQMKWNEIIINISQWIVDLSSKLQHHKKEAPVYLPPVHRDSVTIQLFVFWLVQVSFNVHFDWLYYSHI